MNSTPEYLASPTPAPGQPARRRSGLLAVGLAAAGLVGGITVATLGTAAAQTDPTPAPSANSDAPGKAPLPDGPGRHGGRGGHGPGKFGLGFGIHGEMTTEAPGGGYQTLATQRGEVTSVSATSLTVKSVDGFSRTYVIDDNTLVNAGNNGISDVKSGNTVHVVAIVKDGKANAVDVMDGTNIRELRGRWQPRRMKPEGESPSTAPSSSTSGTDLTPRSGHAGVVGIGGATTQTGHTSGTRRYR
jgi:hypothetical protein